MKNDPAVEEIKGIYSSIQDKILLRLKQFKKMWETGTNEDMFAELVFCILTPQSRAKSCWTAVEHLRNRGLLTNCDVNGIRKELNIVRFGNKKAEYIVSARKKLTINGRMSIKDILSRFDDPYQAREWLVKNIKGIGYKEASHFLRNIGKGEELAILDRHIFKNLELLGVIGEVPQNPSNKRYIEIEKGMQEFANRIKIPMSHLDFVLWSRETGELFK